MINTSLEIIELIKENPELEIVVMANTQNLTDEYGYLLLEKIKVEVADIYNSPDNETLYFDKKEIVEELRKYLADKEEYAEMTDEEYDKMCEEKAKDYFYKRAIVIWASNLG